jgi:hypothetical protein
MNSTKYAILTDNIEKAEIQLLTSLKTDLNEKGELQISYADEPVEFAYLDDCGERNLVTIDKINKTVFLQLWYTLLKSTVKKLMNGFAL